MLPRDKLERLQNEYAILHLLYHRNYNQHRVAIWWRYLNMLHRGVRKVLRRIYDIEECKKIKRKEQLQREVVLTANHLLTRVVGKALHHFHGVIALGQFINLGLVLVASLSALRALLLEIEGVSGRVARDETPLTAPVEDDIGEEVVYESARKPSEEVKVKVAEEPPKMESFDLNLDLGISEKSKKKKKKSKDGSDKPKKKKKAKSVMDDIFG